MIKTIASTRVSQPAFKATAPVADPLAVSDIRVAATEAPPAEAAPAPSTGSWRKALLGVVGAAAILGPLGAGLAHAETPAPAPTVQVEQHDTSAASVEAHFTNANFQRGGGHAAPAGGGHQSFGGNFGGGRQTGGGNFGGRQTFGGGQTFGRGNQGSFNRGNQGFGNQGNWNRGGQSHPQAPSRPNFPSGRQTFPGGRENFPGGRQTFPGQAGHWNSPQPMQRIEHGGRSYDIPRGGFVSRAHIDHPDMRSTVIVRNEYHNSYVNVHEWNRGHWGDDWFYHPYGFYAGNAFWAGYMMGEDWAMMTNPSMFMQQPIYVVSPMTGTVCGQLEAPGGGAYSSETAAQVGALSLMANPQQTDGQYDAGAGLYRADASGQATSERIAAPYAYNLLNHGQSVVFHPPNGDYEQLSSLNDLAPYIVTSSPAAAQ
ncbi:MAG TPA: hypothetical protein VGO93_03190 [Candidatus Xenobia bacterium]|jgi:hypothetical protein